MEFDKEKIREEAEEEHKRLSDLYKENRFLFEREKRKLINDIINDAPDDMKEKLKDLQKSIDDTLKKAGKDNRLAVMQSMFWNHFFDVWKPIFDELKSVKEN